MNIKAKKGNSLISVLVTLGVLITLGTVMISLTAADYKARVAQSIKVKYLYASESGLEEAKGIIGKIIESSIEEANTAVEEYISALSKKSIEEDEIKRIQNTVFKAAYREKVKASIISKIDDHDGEILIKDTEGSKEVVIKSQKEDLVFNDKGVLALSLLSSFIPKSSSDYGEKRIVKADFKIETPEYRSPYYVENTVVNVPLRSIWSKSMVIGGNLQAEGRGEIKGDIHVKGKVKEKDEKGIILTGENTELIINGSAATEEDTVIASKGSSLILNNPMSSLYTDSLSIRKNASDSYIKVNGKVFANNDLVLNGLRSHIIINKGFYGFNDVRELNSENDKWKNSSSIIVNSEDIGEGSGIVIKEEAVIMGTAYIKTKDEYQTGESVAVKGNYRAYSSLINNDPDNKLNEENIVLEYKNPLQLATKFKDGRELNFKDKSRYFKLYSQKDNHNLKLKGISLPENTISVGSVITEKEDGSQIVIEENYIIDEYSVIDKAEKHYKALKEIDDLEEEIDFNKLTEPIKSIVHSTDFTEVLYLKRDREPIVITAQGAVSSKGENIVLKEGMGKGLIITHGDVYLNGNINFTGSIIAGGSVILMDNGKKTIDYDSAYLKELIALNLNRMESIFKEAAPEDYQQVEINYNIKSDDRMVIL
ncbi:hypothetical protein [Clostridium polynesiense]|uniref:hypothetical protein n=1 Tax=Clostridium polynesiense TaxID=1325933 RepID=UPI00058B7A13|nr:hypothetical protein [Clostridium polynesiense]